MFEDLLVRRAYEYSTRRPDLEDRLPSFTRVRKIALSRRQVDLERRGDQEAIIVNLQAQARELSREAETWKRSRRRRWTEGFACRMKRIS